MIRLIETQSRWGNGYLRRHYIDGKRVSEHEFSVAYLAHGFSADSGAMSNTRYGFRKVWESHV